MKNNIILTESQLKRIIEKVIAEQDKSYTVGDLKNMGLLGGKPPTQQWTPPARGEKYGESRGPGRIAKEGNIRPSITLPSGLFKNGIDRIDTSSVEFKNGINAIADAVKKRDKI
jgi:hypothetical protein